MVGTGLQFLESVAERSKVQIRRYLESRRWNRLFFRIGSCGEDAFLELAIAFECVVTFFLRQFFKFVHVAADGVRQSVKFKGKYICVGETHHGSAGGLGKGAAINEIGIVEMGVPVEIVVDRVIDSAATFATVAEV